MRELADYNLHLWLVSVENSIIHDGMYVQYKRICTYIFERSNWIHLVVIVTTTFYFACLVYVQRWIWTGNNILIKDADPTDMADSLERINYQCVIYFSPLVGRNANFTYDTCNFWLNEFPSKIFCKNFQYRHFFIFKIKITNHFCLTFPANYFKRTLQMLSDSF